MNLFSKWMHLFSDETTLADPDQVKTVRQLVQTLLYRQTRIWWSADKDFPQLHPLYSPAQQRANEKNLQEMVHGLVYEMKHIPLAQENRQLQAGRMKTHARQFASQVFNLEQGDLEFIENSGLLTAAEEFARKARAFDPNLSAEDIYQAGRNVMTMNFMQLLLGLQVEITPAVFAYSMLYPYTDNYLDDPGISPTTKLAFNHRFQQRLEGDNVRPANPYETTISNLVEMIETQWDRERYPRVYESLLAIHAAQVKSLGMVAPNSGPYELDVLGVSFEKGGTSVLADGYLVAGELTPGQAALMFGYGAFTQLMDDLEDIRSDQAEGQLTLFSQTAAHWPLDALTNRVFHFGREVFSDLSAFHSPAVKPLKALIDHFIDPLLIDSIGRAGSPLYSNAYLHQIEQHFPFRFEILRRQREALTRQKITFERLFDTLLLHA
jgi:hypothetical protein